MRKLKTEIQDELTRERMRAHKIETDYKKLREGAQQAVETWDQLKPELDRLTRERDQWKDATQSVNKDRKAIWHDLCTLTAERDKLIAERDEWKAMAETVNRDRGMLRAELRKIDQLTADLRAVTEERDTLRAALDVQEIKRRSLAETAENRRIENALLRGELEKARAAAIRPKKPAGVIIGEALIFTVAVLIALALNALIAALIGA